MNRKIEETVRRCAEPLHDDWTLEQEVAQELRLHLEDKCEELEQRGMAPAQSVEHALRSFGDPEEIGGGLLRANFPKLRLYAKVKWAVRILIVPALLLALFCSLNFNVIDGIARYNLLAGEWQERAVYLPKPLAALAAWWAGKPSLTEEERLLCEEGATPQETLAKRKKLSDLHPDDPVLLAAYVRAAEPVYKPGKEWAEVLKTAQRREPGNALYHYLLAQNLMDYFINEHKVLDEGELSREQRAPALEEYRKALACPYNRDYLTELTDRISRILYPGDSLADRIGRKQVIFQTTLPQLAAYRGMARALRGEAKQRIAEGKYAEAEQLMDSWKAFIRQITGQTNTLIGVIVVCVIQKNFIEDFPGLYAQLGKPEKSSRAVAELTALHRISDDWYKASRPGSQANSPARKESLAHIRKYGGIFSRLVWTNYFAPLRAESLLMDRRITYGIYDTFVVALFGGMGTAQALLLGLLWLIGRFTGHKGHFLRLTASGYVRLLIYGILLPLLLYWLWIHTDLLSGRGGNIAENGWFHLQAAVFLIGFPAWFLWLLGKLQRKRIREILPLAGDGRPPQLSRMTRLTSLIPLWVLFILLSGSLMRFALHRELQYNMAREPLFFSAFMSEPEDHSWQQARAAILKTLTETGKD